MCVPRVIDGGCAAAAVEPESTSERRLAAIRRPLSHATVQRLEQQVATRCLDSVGLAVVQYPGPTWRLSIERMGGYLVLCGLLRPVEHGLFASGGDQMLGFDSLG